MRARYELSARTKAKCIPVLKLYPEDAEEDSRSDQIDAKGGEVVLCNDGQKTLDGQPSDDERDRKAHQKHRRSVEGEAAVLFKQGVARGCGHRRYRQQK